MEKSDISILIADDDENIRHIVERYLAGSGFSVTAVEDGAIALGKLERLAFDICVLDIHMPHLNGMELVGRIRDIRPDCMILFITGEANEAEIRRIYHENMGVAVLRKPFRLESLRGYVEMLAEKIDVSRRETGFAERHEAFVAGLPPVRRIAWRTGRALRRVHESYALYVVVAALVAAFAILTAYDRLQLATERSEKSLTQMYENMMQLLERWEKEDTRRDRR